ncbi:MAG: DUF4296 domain-containing protein, partial [Alistipes sp.]|nr:DUF4296 domain-containing protein [Candidatus Minthomonas equi]
ADQSISINNLHKEVDSILIYTPIFEKYGYSLEEYTSSVNSYLQRPDKFTKVFTEVKQRLERRLKELDDSLALINRLSTKWALLDSVHTLGTDKELTTPMYRILDMMFFQKDTSLLENYPMPDSSVLESYRLNVFELYDGNPFSTEVPPGRCMALLPDTLSTAKADSTISSGNAGKDDTTHTEPVSRKTNGLQKIKKN